jgi:GMP synthase-like glutamine amidotransferase
MGRHILGIVCDPPVEGRNSWPDQISTLLATTHPDACGALSWTFVDVFAGRKLPSIVMEDTAQSPPQYFDAVIISGSIFNITDIDATEWMRATLHWVRLFVAAYPRVPVVGICFGHQLLATLFGGVVKTNPLGWEVGTHRLMVAAAANDDDHDADHIGNQTPLYGHAKEIRVQETHSQIVATLPTQGARVIAFTSKDPHHVVLYASQVLGMQYHPEYDIRHMQQLQDADKGNGNDVAGEWEEIVESSAESMEVVGRFITSHWSR